MQNRTGVDFSQHDLTITKTPTYTIYDLKKPDSDYFQRVTFINICGILVVKGDYGNWVFCREFHPSIREKVSDHYWAEKLQINSTQDPFEFDSNKTEQLLRKGIESDLEDYGYEGDTLKEIQKYYSRCLDYVHCSEWEYTTFAYNDAPSFLDAENVPFVKSINFQLLVVFDAFDEMCERSKEE